jgi:hypothetical protein
VDVLVDHQDRKLLRPSARQRLTFVYVPSAATAGKIAAVPMTGWAFVGRAGQGKLAVKG